MAPSQDASDHQDYYIFSRESQPKHMAFDIHFYESKKDTHPEKTYQTYQYLMDMMNKHIRVKRDEKNREAKNLGLKHLTSKCKSFASPAESSSEKPALKTPERASIQ